MDSLSVGESAVCKCVKAESTLFVSSLSSCIRNHLLVSETSLARLTGSQQGLYILSGFNKTTGVICICLDLI